MNKPAPVVLPCGETSESVETLEANGWQLLFSFDSSDPQAVKMARDRIVWAKTLRDYLIVRVNGHHLSEVNGNVVCLYFHTKCEIFPRTDSWYNRVD